MDIRAPLSVLLEINLRFCKKKIFFSSFTKFLDRQWTYETTLKKNTFHTSASRVKPLVEVEAKYVSADMFQFYKVWAAQSKHPALVRKEKKVWHCINSLQCFAHWGWTGAEGVDGCPGPTAAWHRGTENPSVWGTLHLLCSAHSTIDMRLPFVLSTKTIQVSPDRSRTPWTQYLTAAHVQICRVQKSLWKW